MKWTALNCKRHQTSLTERWKARVCIEDAACLVPRVRPRSLCAWQIPYERQSNVQNYNRGIFDLSLSFVHSVEFRFVANTCLDSSSIGWWLQTIQFKRDSLFLWKEWVERIDSILEGQKKLKNTNAVLQQENAKLKNQLASLEGQAKKKGNKRSKSSRRDSNVVIPNDLRVNIL